MKMFKQTSISKVVIKVNYFFFGLNLPFFFLSEHSIDLNLLDQNSDRPHSQQNYQAEVNIEVANNDPIADVSNPSFDSTKSTQELNTSSTFAEFRKEDNKKILKKLQYQLVEITPTNRGGLSFHFKIEHKGKTKFVELIKESCYNHRLGLICKLKDRKDKDKKDKTKCTARFHLPLLNLSTEEYKTESGITKYRITSSIEDQKILSNYGELYHTHSNRCKGLNFN